MKSLLIKILFVLIIVFLSVMFFVSQKADAPTEKQATEKIENAEEVASTENEQGDAFMETEEAEEVSDLELPLSKANERITKKPFGIFIDPATSPVQPERFSGFHTGTDFEIFPEELNEDVEVSAICAGEVLQKSFVGGYGGVIIQSCTFNNEPATVLYGHLNLKNSPVDTGDIVKKDELLATLADNQSRDSDGERKHLHLGIHKGSGIELRGYVQNKNALKGWIDFETLAL